MIPCFRSAITKLGVCLLFTIRYIFLVVMGKVHFVLFLSIDFLSFCYAGGLIIGIRKNSMINDDSF